MKSSGFNIRSHEGIIVLSLWGLAFSFAVMILFLLSGYYSILIVSTIFLILSLWMLMSSVLAILRYLNDLKVTAGELGKGNFNLNKFQAGTLNSLSEDLGESLILLGEHFSESSKKLKTAESALNLERTIHKESREALEKSEMLFRQMWDISVDGMRLINAEGIALRINEAYARLVSLSREQIEGHLFTEVYHPSSRDDIYKFFLDDVKRGTIKSSFEREDQLWNGKKLWFEFSNSFLDIPGSGIMVLSVIKDITDRKKSEIELQKSERRYRELFSNANDALFVNYLNYGKTFSNFIEVNDIACQRLGYSREQLLRLSPVTLSSPEFEQEIPNIIDSLMAGRHIIYETTHLTSDHRFIPVEISSHIFEFNERPAVLSIARDLSERKLSEEKLKKSTDQLRSLASRLRLIREEERKTIAREIHDELGQVLTVLKIQLTLIANKLSTADQPLKEKFSSSLMMIDSIVDSVQRISGNLRPGVLDDLGLTAAIEWQSNEFAERTGIACKCELPKEEVNLKTAQATAVFRIFQEALTNAARHSNANRINILLEMTDGGICLEIKDNGKGITKNQINDSKSLGLLGMQERALEFGGNVTIKSSMGNGTTVKVFMPLR